MTRAGSRVLSVFTNALSARVLRTHTDGPLSPRELEEALGWAPQSSLRAAVAKLSDLGALARIDRSESSPGKTTELTVAGRELLPVSAELGRWLQGAPDGPIPLDDAAAQGIVRVLTTAWDAAIVRSLAERPQTLLELNAANAHLNYPALKRRLAKLRSTHLASPARTDAGMAYGASDWLRRAVVPFLLAARWEREHDASAEPISQVEIEAALLLALPLVDLSSTASGACALAVLMPDDRAGRRREVSGVSVEIVRGAITAYGVDAATAPPTWALGAIDAWLETLIDGNSSALRVGGAKPRLAQGLVNALHTDLYRS